MTAPDRVIVLPELVPAALYPANVAARIRIQDDGCWTYDGAHCSGGYAMARLDGRAQRLARWLLLAHGLVPAGWQTDHVCAVKGCVCPTHVQAVPPFWNWQRGSSPGAVMRRTGRCTRGHDLTADGAWYVPPSGRRMCARCVRVRSVARSTARRLRGTDAAPGAA